MSRHADCSGEKLEDRNREKYSRRGVGLDGLKDGGR